MKNSKLIVLLVALLSCAASYADPASSDAANRAKFASLYPLGEATVTRLENERGAKFTFSEVRALVKGPTWDSERSKTDKLKRDRNSTAN